MLFGFFRREPTEEEMWGPHAAIFKPIEPPQTPSPPGSPPTTLRSKLLEVSSHRELTVTQYKDQPRRTLLAAFASERGRRRELEHALKKVTAERDALALECDRLRFELQRPQRCQCRLRPVRTESTDAVVHWAPPSSRAAVALCTTAPNQSHFSLQDTLATAILQQQQRILASPYQPLSESPSTSSFQESSSTRGASSMRRDSCSEASTALVLTKAKAKAVNIPSKIPRRATPSPPTLRARPRASTSAQLEFKDVVERAALARVRTSDAGSLVPRPRTADDSSASLPSLTMSSTVPSIGSFTSSSLPEGSLPAQLDPSYFRAEDGMATPKAQRARPGFYFEESPRL